LYTFLPDAFQPAHFVQPFGKGFFAIKATAQLAENIKVVARLEPLGTPSGLIEIYSKTIADMNYDDCQGHPMWFEKIERSHGG
ncbi:hypothetical protein ACSLOB_29490, partial [Escherichia coli]